jgi:hypothetical protein
VGPAVRERERGGAVTLTGTRWRRPVRSARMGAAQPRLLSPESNAPASASAWFRALGGGDEPTVRALGRVFALVLLLRNAVAASCSIV